MNTKDTLFTIFLVLLIWTFEIKAQWVQTNGPYGGYVTALKVSGSNIFAGTWIKDNSTGGVFLSTDNGLNWSEAGLKTISVMSFAESGNYILAGTSGHGVFLSSDNGSNWSGANNNYVLSNTVVKSFVINGSNIFCGSDSF